PACRDDAGQADRYRASRSRGGQGRHRVPDPGAHRGDPFVPRRTGNDRTPMAAVAITDLRQQLGYLNPSDIGRIAEASQFSDARHQGQFMLSGHPYISHPLAVAEIVADWQLDTQAVMAALLHDVMEDTSISKQQITERFGKPVAELVDGLSKLDKIEFQSQADAHAEKFPKVLLAMAGDWRGIPN